MIEFRVLDYWVLECDVPCVRCVCGFVGEDMGKLTEHIEEFLVLSDRKQHIEGFLVLSDRKQQIFPARFICAA